MLRQNSQSNYALMREVADSRETLLADAETNVLESGRERLPSMEKYKLISAQQFEPFSDYFRNISRSISECWIVFGRLDGFRSIVCEFFASSKS